MQIKYVKCTMDLVAFMRKFSKNRGKENKLKKKLELASTKCFVLIYFLL